MFIITIPAYIYAYNLIRWATFRLQKVLEKQRERYEKLRQEEAKNEKEDKTVKRENPHTKCGGFSGVIFYYKTG